MRRFSLVVLAVSLSTVAPHVVRAQSTRIEIRTRGDGVVECYRDSRRVDCDSLRSDRDRDYSRDIDRAQERAREQARIRAEEARERADDARRRTDELRRLELARQADRIRDVQRIADAARARALAEQRRRRRDDLRPRIGLGAGADLRSFDAVNRYTSQLGVDFHGWSGLGIRPEVIYAWSDRQQISVPTVICAGCATLNSVDYQYRTRSRLLGANLNATYTFMRGSPIRPYVIGGVGIVTTREVAPVVATSVPLSGPLAGAALSYQTEARDRTDFALNSGAGLEFGRGPVRLFTELRYYLLDGSMTRRGFSGMLPISAGIRF